MRAAVRETVGASLGMQADCLGRLQEAWLFGVSLATLRALTQKHVTRPVLSFSLAQMNMAVVSTGCLATGTRKQT